MGDLKRNTIRNSLDMKGLRFCLLATHLFSIFDHIFVIAKEQTERDGQWEMAASQSSMEKMSCCCLVLLQAFALKRRIDTLLCKMLFFYPSRKKWSDKKERKHCSQRAKQYFSVHTLFICIGYNSDTKIREICLSIYSGIHYMQLYDDFEKICTKTNCNALFAFKKILWNKDELRCSWTCNSEWNAFPRNICVILFSSIYCALVIN